MPALGAGAWAGGLLAPLVPLGRAVAAVGCAAPGRPVVLLGVGGGALRPPPVAPGGGGARRRCAAAPWSGCWRCCSPCWRALVRADRLAHDPVARLAAEGASVTVERTVTGDPRLTAGRSATGCCFAARGSGCRAAARRTTAAPVLVIADDAVARAAARAHRAGVRAARAVARPDRRRS